MVCYNFFKNWFHVSAVVFYGSYSYFSGVVIFDIYAYELFNVFFATLPIIVYSIFDMEYSFEESIKFPSLYSPGLQNSFFNEIVYYKNIGQGVLYGFFSIVTIFMVLED